MTLFDLIVLGVLALSALVGFVRGAAREVVTVAAFLLAALAAVFLLRFTAPMARAAIDPDWAAVGVAIAVVFLIVYIAVRVAGGSLTARIKESPLGTFDRAVGLGFGLIRGLVAVGVFHLVFHTVTDPERIPRWISTAATYPLTGWTADQLRVISREGQTQAGSLGPAIEKAVREGAEPTPGEGYEEKDRQKMDDLVEERAR